MGTKNYRYEVLSYTIPYFKIACTRLSQGLHKSIQGSVLLLYCPTTSRTIRLCAHHKYPLLLAVLGKVKRRLQRFSYHDNKDISVFQRLETLLFPCMQFTVSPGAYSLYHHWSKKTQRHHILFKLTFHLLFSYPPKKPQTLSIFFVDAFLEHSSHLLNFWNFHFTYRTWLSKTKDFIIY